MDESEAAAQCGGQKTHRCHQPFLRVGLGLWWSARRETNAVPQARVSRRVRPSFVSFRAPSTEGSSFAVTRQEIKEMYLLMRGAAFSASSAFAPTPPHFVHMYVSYAKRISRRGDRTRRCGIDISHKCVASGPAYAFTATRTATPLPRSLLSRPLLAAPRLIVASARSLRPRLVQLLLRPCMCRSLCLERSHSGVSSPFG